MKSNKIKKWYEELYEDFQHYEDEPYTQNTMTEVDFIEKVIDADHRKHILDVGCGNGRHALELASRGYTVTGIDISPSMIAQARQHAEKGNINASFLQGDARHLTYLDDFDTVIMLCEGAFSLMEDDVMDQIILQQCFKALRSPGMLIMTVPNALYMLSKENENFNPLTLRETFTLEKILPDGSKKTLDCTQRYYTYPEMTVLLQLTGFHRIDYFVVTETGYSRDIAINKEQFEFGVIAQK